LSDLLAEHDYGAWEGLTDAEIESGFPGELARRRTDHWSYRIPDGESYELVAVRVRQWLSDHDAGVVVAVTHDIVSRILRGLYMNLSPDRVFELVHPHTRVYLLASGSIQQFDVSDALVEPVVRQRSIAGA
jgi:broad specificity phosphatase PhoE